MAIERFLLDAKQEIAQQLKSQEHLEGTETATPKLEKDKGSMRCYQSLRARPSGAAMVVVFARDLN